MVIAVGLAMFLSSIIILMIKPHGSAPGKLSTMQVMLRNISGLQPHWPTIGGTL